MQLQKENTDLRAKIETFIQNENILRETIKGNEQTIDALRKENEELKKKLKELEDKFNILETDHNKLNKDHHDFKIKHQEQIDNLNKKIEQLEIRDLPITIREGFVSLEKYIMLEICGSKNKARSFHDVKELFNSKDSLYQQKCTDYLINHDITQDHIFIISELKDKENKSAHAIRPVMKRNEWDQLAIQMLDDPLDFDDIALTKDLLKLMESYKVGSDNMWNISKPF
jgi:DNA repair exonuclease SbcCD ATPase subunit